MIFMKRFNTVFYRLLSTYIILVVFLISLVGMTSYVSFSKSFNSEMSRLYNKVVEQFNQSIDSSIIQKTNQIYMSLIMERQKNSDLYYLFDYPAKGNSEKILTTYNLFKETVSSNGDILDSIQIYYNTNNLIISSQGVKYLDDDSISGASHFDLDWLEKFNRAGVNSLWTENKVADKSSSNSSKPKRVISLVRAIPFPSPSETRKGCIAINIQEDAIHNIIRQTSVEEFPIILLIDNYGNIISQSNMNMLFKDISAEPFLKQVYESKKAFGSIEIKIQKSNIWGR